MFGKAFLSVKLKEKDSEKSWHVDSGATSHMTISKKIFSEFDPSVKGHVLLAEENTTSEVKGMGSGVIKCIVDGQIREIPVQNVLYVPSLSSNLLSVKRLTKDGYSVNFQLDSCKVIKDGKVQAIARLERNIQGLYKVESDVERAWTAINNKQHGANCQHTWHRRFGHRDPQAIKDFEENELAIGIDIKDCGIREICECCIKGKMSRKPFPKEAQRRSKRIFDLIHTDVCGPMQTMTPGKKMYLITIINDFSRFTTVHFMETKDEATTHIKQFVEMAKTQFNKTPKCVRSDRGREYVNADLQNYLKNKGIKRKYTAAYSPQQNGVAERKNRSLLEMVRCMLLDAHLDKKYWAEAVNTANFLQNGLPTKAAERTPYELMYSQKPDVRNLHIFGSDAYVQIPKEKCRKLDDKAERFTFVGYWEESKAFRLIDKKTDRVRISRDVIFLDKELTGEPSTNHRNQEIILIPNKIPEEI